MILVSGCAAVQKEPLQAASLLFQGIQFVLSNSVPSKIPVSATGTGNSREEAIQNALRSAMQEGVGVLVVSETSVHGQSVTKDIVTQYSSAIVQSYKVENCSESARVSCDVTAIVTPWRFFEALEVNATKSKVDGKSLYAQHLTAQQAIRQRYRLSEYFLSKIRLHGLEAVLEDLQIVPTNATEATIHLRYRVRYKREFWTELVSFLERLETDTGGGQTLTGRREPKLPGDPHTVILQWGPTGMRENRVFIHTYDRALAVLFDTYSRQIPIRVSLYELGLCDEIALGDSYGRGFSGNIFQIDWYGLNREIRLKVPTHRLKAINQLSLRMGCEFS